MRAKCFNFGRSIRRRRHFIINAKRRGEGHEAEEVGEFVQIAKRQPRASEVIERTFVAGRKRQTKLEANFECLWPVAKCKWQCDRDSHRCCGWAS